MRCLVMARKHVNNIWATAKQLPITAMEGLLKAVFSVGSTPRLYSEDRMLAEHSSVEWSEVAGVWQFSRALQQRLRSDD
jgi:hypothetical protein